MNVVLFLFQPWSENFSGLWQTQPWNFQKERAFNIAVSKDSTQCCVCSVFKSPSLFQFFKPKLVSEVYKELMSELHSGEELCSKTITELRVVVQRVLIDVPHSSKETVAVTGSEQEDDLITCHSCGICVHRCEEP